MKLTRYKQASTYEVRRQLAKALDLNPYQKDILADVLDALPFSFMEFQKAVKPKLKHRLTAPVFCVVFSAAILFMPVKWLFTGTKFYQPEGRFFKFMNNWQRVIGF